MTTSGSSKYLQHVVNKAEVERLAGGRPRSRALRYWRRELYAGSEPHNDNRAALDHTAETIRLSDSVLEEGLQDDLGPHYRHKLAMWNARALLKLIAAPDFPQTVDQPAWTASEEQRLEWATRALSLARNAKTVGHRAGRLEFRHQRELLVLEAKTLQTVEGQEASDRCWRDAEALLRKLAEGEFGRRRDSASVEIGQLLLEKAFKWSSLERWREVPKLIHEALKFVPSDDTISLAQAYTLLAQSRIYEGDFEGAEAELEPGLQPESMSFEYPPFAYVAARVAVGLKNLPKALRRVRRGLDENASDQPLKTLEEEIQGKIKAAKAAKDKF